MEWVSNNGKMVQNMKVILPTVQKMVVELWYLVLIVLFLMVILNRMNSKVRVS
jgi:hypothetical protein